MYDAIIFDLDGTAMRGGYDATPSLKVCNMVKKHVGTMHLCAATGRPWSFAKNSLQALGLSDPCVIAGGTQLVDPMSGKILWEDTISKSSIEKIFTIAREYTCRINASNLLPQEIPMSSNAILPKKCNSIFLLECSKIDAEKLLKQLETINEITAIPAKCLTVDGIDIHITSKTGTKEHGVAQLLLYLNLSKKRSIGVGDGDNDEHLFRSVGYKIAMSNATDHLKALADEICPPVDMDGLAWVINKYSR